MGIVTVIGSYNVGLFLKGGRIPAVGETVIGDSFFEGGGGKGSNQALAAAKMGADVRFIGRVGGDKYGDDALGLYREFGLSPDGLIRDASTHSGISVIFIDGEGRNSIMVIPGANFNMTRADIDDRAELLKRSAIVGFQLENRLDVVLYGIRKCHDWGIPVLLDPAPAIELPRDIYKCITYIKPNEVEASALSGIDVRDEKSAGAAGKWFLERGVKTAVVTLGEKGAVTVGAEGTAVYAAPRVEPVDTTGAGDIFSGALLACLAGGLGLPESVKTASAAAALSVTKAGVVSAIPEYKDVMELYQTLQGAGNDPA